MSFFKKLFSEFVDIIEWIDVSRDIIVWKFPRYQDEIKMGAKLTVREGQVAVFMNEGVIADVFPPGLYTLTTENMPVLTTLRSWPYGFDSPFKADVYFVNTRQFTDQKWGTRHPVIHRDTEFGAVRLRAFGSFSFRVSDAALFIREIVSSNPEFATENISEHLINIALTKCIDAIAEKKIPLLDLSAHYEEISDIITEKVKPEVAKIGLEITKFLVENISLPQEVEKALDKRSSMNLISDLGRYTHYQAANAIEKSAENRGLGGVGSAGLEIGMGLAAAGHVSNMLKPYGTDSDSPPPLPPVSKYYVGIDGQQEGPYDIDQLRQMSEDLVLLRSTMVWKNGMTAWAPADSVPDLKDIFSNVPPPLPA